MLCGQGGLYGPYRGGRKFDGLGLQGQTDISSVRNIFEGSFTEERIGQVNYIFEGGFKFEASETRKRFNNTTSAYRVVIGEILGIDQGVIGEQAIKKLMAIYEK